MSVGGAAVSADAAVADDRTVECVIRIGDSAGSAATRNGDAGSIIQIGSTSMDHGIEQHHREGYGAISQLFGGGCDVDRGLEQIGGWNLRVGPIHPLQSATGNHACLWPSTYSTPRSECQKF